MPFIGNQPAESYSAFQKQDFSTSATTSYTLDHPVANANEIALFINFVRQEPTTAYTASGTSLTLTSATSASDDMYCVYLGKAVQTVNPPSGSVGTAQLADSAVSTAKIADDAVTKAKTSNLMYPAFEAFLSSDQSVTDVTETKAQVNSEVFDTDGCYDNSTNYRFTPTTAGKYFVYGRVATDEAAGNTRQSITYIYKNGTEVARSYVNFHESTSSTTDGEGASPQCIAVIDMNGSTDYLELYGLHDVNSGSAIFSGHSTRRYTSFGAYRIGD